MNILSLKEKNKLVKNVLASTLFMLAPFNLHAGLVPVLVSTDSTTTPDAGQGYEFINILGPITLTINDGFSIGHSFIPLLGINDSVDALTAPIGLTDTLAFAGDATVTAAIGAMNAIGTIDLNGANKTVNFQGNINTTTMNFTQDAIANLSDTVIITGAIDNTSGVANKGTLQYQGGGQVTGDIGNTKALKLITIDAAGSAGKTLELDGGVIKSASINLNDDGSGNPINGTTLKLNNVAMALTGNITTNTNNENTLDITNAASLQGNIGKIGNALNLIKVGLHNNTTITGNIFATTTQFQGNNTLILADGDVITGAVDSTAAGIGSLEFQGSGQITGNIGSNNTIALITLNSGAGINKQVELDGSIIRATSINTVGGGGNPTTLLLNSPGVMALTGNITSNNNNLDILNIANTGVTTIIGNIGTSGKALNSILVGQNNDTIVTGNITATTTEFQGDHTLSLGDGNVITGAIDTTVSGTGTLQFQGGGRVSGNIGNANKLNLVNFNSTGGLNKTIELDGAVIKANTLNIIGNAGSATTLLLNGPGAMALSGNIATNNNNLDIINIANTGPTTINGNIGGVNHAFNLLKVGQNAATTVNGNIYSLMTQFQGNNILNIGNNDNIFGAVDSIATGNGILNFQGNSTITGNIGNSNSIAAINLQGIGSTVNFQGNVSAAATNFTANGTATLANGKVFNGPVTASVADQGTLIFLGTSTINYPIGDAPLNNITFNGGPGTVVNLQNDLFATNTLVNNGGTLFVNTPQTINGNFSVTNGSILSLTTGANPLTVTGDFDLGAGTTFQLDMGSIVAAGSVNDQGTATVDAASKVVITNAPGLIPGGKATITIVTDGTGGGANLHTIPVLSNSLLTKFSTEVNGNLLQLVITTNSANPFICNNFEISNVLDDLRNSANISGTLQNIINQLGTFTDEEALCENVSLLSPVVDAGVVFESFEAQRQNFNIIQEQAELMHFCKSHPEHFICNKRPNGISAGDMTFIEDRVWVKLLRQVADQDERQGIDGYKDYMNGIAIGGESLFGENAIIGIAFSWANLNIHQRNDQAKTDVDSYQETIYGNYDFESPIYVNWAAGIAYNAYAMDRNFIFGNIVLAPTGKFHGWQSGAKAEIGYDIENNMIHAIPLASLYYSHLALSEYTERGLDTADQQVQDANYNMLLGGAGIKFIYDNSYDICLYQLEAHLMTYYDFVGDRMQNTSQFVGGGPSFTTIGFKPARGLINLGARINIFTTTGFDFFGGMDWNAKDDYSSILGYLKLRYEW